jgi:parallel beta-helix repeat protein
LKQSTIKEFIVQYSYTLDGTVYGAVPDASPIGGGESYLSPVTSGNYTVTTPDELLTALASATSGEVVFIPNETVIDMTPEVYLNATSLAPAAGVTLAGNRGVGGSLGGQIMCDALDTFALIRPAGAGVRITGLRITGSNTRQYTQWYDKTGGSGSWSTFPVQRGIWSDDDDLEVDNCEISGFGHVGIYLYDSDDANIHHNYIHHCQYEGLGYGITQRDAQRTLIQYNLFDWNRHGIASTGNTLCSYTAKHNVQFRYCLSHAFDVHENGSAPGSSGDFFVIENNTFYNLSELGVPYFGVKFIGAPPNTNGTTSVTKNWFAVHELESTAVSEVGGATVDDNLYKTPTYDGLWQAL